MPDISSNLVYLNCIHLYDFLSPFCLFDKQKVAWGMILIGPFKIILADACIFSNFYTSPCVYEFKLNNNNSNNITEGSVSMH